ncbi:MAG: YdeI/OmpD-associated family protein [Rhodobacteraceae bacterium]|nr:YdeI/OmpD-associated family protein [Paracoccaceae bacterium]
MITEIDDYFAKGCGRCARFDTADCSALRWGAGVAALRQLCLAAGLEETVKWGHPCYVHVGRNVALIGALRGDFRLSFFDAGLMADPEGVLERQGANTQHPDTIRFTDPARVAALAPVIHAYLTEAMGHAAAGRRVPKAAVEVVLPEELIEALDMDPALAEAFHALTLGRQRSYVITLNGAKEAETRRRRIAGFHDKILSGKGATER